MTRLCVGIMVINKTLEWSDKQSIAFLITEEEDKRASEPSTQEESLVPCRSFMKVQALFWKLVYKKIYMCLTGLILPTLKNTVTTFAVF